MGLSMYLSKSTYVEKVTMNNKTKKDIKPERVSEIIEDVMYWRKANHIHTWFVENCQDGEDNCERAHVSRDQLDELATLCERHYGLRQMENLLMKYYQHKQDFSMARQSMMNIITANVKKQLK